MSQPIVFATETTMTLTLVGSSYRSDQLGWCLRGTLIVVCNQARCVGCLGYKLKLVDPKFINERVKILCEHIFPIQYHQNVICQRKFQLFISCKNFNLSFIIAFSQTVFSRPLRNLIWLFRLIDCCVDWTQPYDLFRGASWPIIQPFVSSYFVDPSFVVVQLCMIGRKEPRIYGFKQGREQHRLKTNS